MRRVNCRNCGMVVVEEVPWGDGKHQLSRAYMLFLARWARKLSWKETAETFHTSWDKVCDAVEYVVAWGLEHRTLESIRAIGVDEIRQKCSQALHILDRFHIVAKMNKALDEVRASETRRMAQDGHEPLLKKSRWCVLKRKENLTSQQKFRLRDLLRYNLQTVRAYLLKEDFQQFWEYNSPTWAAKFLDEWCQQAMRSRIEPMKKVANTLRSHRELILNYFRAKKQFSSGVIEGLNNKAK